VDASLAREAGALYELPVGEFITARNARAKALRKESPELAAEVAKLPKPTAAAAAVNRLARRDPSEVRALIQAGKRLRDAQERAVGGRSGGENLQEAVREHRAALERVQRETRKLRLSEPVLERAVSTFRAASIDPELQPLLERGLLAREVESAGFAIDPTLAVAPAGKRRSSPPREDTGKQRQAARAKLKAATETLADARREAAAAGRELKRVQRTADEAGRAVQDAEREVDEASQQLKGS
jgi:chromosome segregation ATPase